MNYFEWLIVLVDFAKRRRRSGSRLIRMVCELYMCCRSLSFYLFPGVDLGEGRATCENRRILLMFCVRACPEADEMHARIESVRAMTPNSVPALTLS